jgi:hypothetical protein
MRFPITKKIVHFPPLVLSRSGKRVGDLSLSAAVSSSPAILNFQSSSVYKKNQTSQTPTPGRVNAPWC